MCWLFYYWCHSSYCFIQCLNFAPIKKKLIILTLRNVIWIWLRCQMFHIWPLFIYVYFPHYSSPVKFQPCASPLMFCSGYYLPCPFRHETPVLSKPIEVIHLSEDLVVLDKPCSLPVSQSLHEFSKKKWCGIGKQILGESVSQLSYSNLLF